VFWICIVEGWATGGSENWFSGMSRPSSILLRAISVENTWSVLSWKIVPKHPPNLENRRISMKNKAIFFFVCMMTLNFIPSNGHPCTSFFLNGQDAHLVGKNYDWVIGNGLIVVNKRGMEKKALEDPGTRFDRPVRWTSKYGSITFNQYGRELPMGGINEAGLVVEVLLLAETVYPEPDARPAISMLQWVQYQLDNFSSTREVIASDAHLRILSSHMAPGMHYFVCDQTGHCAGIEFLEGKLVSHTKEKMPVKVLANSTYKVSLHQYRKAKKKSVGRQNGSLERFDKAANMVESFDPKASTSAVAYAFEILKNVAQGSFTQWRIVYDIQNLTVYFLTTSNQEIRQVDLRSFDFSCTSPVKVLDIKGDQSGDVSGAFVDYTGEINRAMIEASFRNTSFLARIPGDLLNELARYPDTNTCLPSK